jgi:hypothetical protein
VADALVYLAGAVLIAWGTAHIANRPVEDSFGDIGIDSRRILTMEWIAEGITHVAIGLLAVLVAAVEGSDGNTAQLVYRFLAAVLVAFAAQTAATGARTPVIWFKLCPFTLGSAAALLLTRTLI